MKGCAGSASVVARIPQACQRVVGRSCAEDAYSPILTSGTMSAVSCVCPSTGKPLAMRVSVTWGQIRYPPSCS